MTVIPAPYAGVVVLPGVEVVCASPELFLSRDGDLVTTGPIKGTAPTAEQLLPKDVDENVMIVDLARNDLSIACSPGTVEVSGPARGRAPPRPGPPGVPGPRPAARPTSAGAGCGRP